ncbi:hypothetical protein FQN57_005147 [Myotisia sp. PD_48]|nr:hypothetical protein FQN57_005147 [Myotisia sp. PD_48]
MARLDSLPLETIHEIVGHLSSINDIYSLARVCSSFYAFINVTERRKYHRIRLMTYRHRVAVYSMLPKMLREPLLAHYVREFEANTRSPSCYVTSLAEIPTIPPKQPRSTEEQENDRLIETALWHAGFQDKEMVEKLLSWMQYAFDRGVFRVCAREAPELRRIMPNAASHALSVVVMSICRNIEVLKLHNFAPGSPIAQLLDRANAINPIKPWLRNLRTVNLSYDQDHWGYGPYDFQGVMGLFHRLPNVKTINISYIAEPNDYMREKGLFQRAPPRTSNFTVIRINHSCIPSSYLSDIIAQPKALTEFTYTLGTREPNPSYSYSIHPIDLRRALLPHKSTVRVLNLDVDYDIRPPKSLVDDDPLCETNSTANALSYCSCCTQSIGSLQSFVSLTHLSIGIQLLLGNPNKANYKSLPTSIRLIDILPPKLQNLSVRGYQSGECQFYTDKISEFMETKDIELPSLQDVRGVKELIPSARHIWDEDHTSWREEENEWASQPEEFPSTDDRSADGYSVLHPPPPPPCSFNFYPDTP